MQIDIWSDIACPFCYVGKRHLEKALEDYPLKEEVKIIWHSFELNPKAPLKQDRPLVELLSHKYQKTLSEAETMIDNMTAMAAESGLSFNLRDSKPTNTFNAHRLIHLAKEFNLQDRAKERFLKAYMVEGADLGEPEVLKDLMLDIGLELSSIEEVLNSERFTREVRVDEQDAYNMGCHGVPFFVFDNMMALSGAQPVEVFKQIFSKLEDKKALKEELSKGQSCSI